MMHLIFDTETTGFYNPKVALTSKLQARVIQLAAILLDDNFKEVTTINTLLKPESHFVIADGAYEQHKINLEMCEKEGRNRHDVLMEFDSMFKQADVLVAHNLKFDCNMLDVEYENESLEQPEIHHICTMERMTNICRLPHKRKNSFGQQFKWPKLMEAYMYIFKKPFEGKEHDGYSDAKACCEIYKWLLEREKKSFNFSKRVSTKTEEMI